jgi:hypothetical protein
VNDLQERLIIANTVHDVYSNATREFARILAAHEEDLEETEKGAVKTHLGELVDVIRWAKRLT